MTRLCLQRHGASLLLRFKRGAFAAAVRFACVLPLAALAAGAPEARWWPMQHAASAIVRTDFSLMVEVAEPDGRKPGLGLGQEHMLAESVAGLAAQAVNEGRGDELVWIGSQSGDYRLWFEGMTNRLRVADRGLFKPRDLVRRFARAGVVKGYILYRYDPSPGGATHLRPGSDESVNVATTLAGLLGGVLVSEGQQAEATRAGLKLLFDARGKTEAWCFEKYRDQLSRRFALVQDPQMPHCRDIAIAHRMMVVFGTNAPTPELYAWLQPLASVLGWNGGDEAASVRPISRAGHTLLPCNWSMNLAALSAGSGDGGGGERESFGGCDPRSIDFNDGQHAVSFIMSDGDNVQWMMGSFATHRDYWASPDHGRFPIGWGAAIGCLDQCSPDTLAYLKRTQPPDCTLNLHAGGYFYPDLLGVERSPEVRRQLLAGHARRVSYYLKRSGCRTYQFIAMDLNSPAAFEAYDIFAREIDGLLGMFAIQYSPYEGGDEKVFWVNNGKGDEVPVVTAKFSLWGDLPSAKPRAGTPAKVARVINDAARAATSTNGTLKAWCVTHTWSSFKRVEGNDEQAENASGDRSAQRAVTPTRWCVERLDPSVKVVSPEELLWRIRMAHAPDQTAAQVRQLEFPKRPPPAESSETSSRPRTSDAAVLAPAPGDFGFLSWDAAPPYFQGQAERPDTPRVLWIETGRYSLAVDTRRVALPHAGPLAQDRIPALGTDRARARGLPPGRLDLCVKANGQVFFCEGLRESKDPWAYPVRIVETGRWLQHVDLDGLVFRSKDGIELDADAHLEISAWPDRATFHAEVQPRVAVNDFSVALTIEASGLNSKCSSMTSNRAVVTLLAPNAVADAGRPPEVTATAADRSAPVVLLRPDLDAWEVKIEGAPWSNPAGTYYPANHLDRLDRWPVILRNDAEQERETRLVFTRSSFTPITGLTPMWLDAEGFPTGLPVQLSKNWHVQPARGHLRHEGPWLRASTVVRVPPRSVRRLDFALCYARYGGVFAASHAQLSLIGWGHNTFWDQAALGSFGESICFEPGRVQRRCFITDVRPFLVTHPPRTNQWEWTANLGGGDFLVYFDADRRYVPFARTRTDYGSPGPRLTRTTYSETSADGAIAARMTVSLPGADDHVRVFLHLRYDVRRDTQFTRLAFFQFGSDFYNCGRPGKLAMGDAGGLVEEWKPGQGSWVYERRGIPLTGSNAWISAHDETLDGAKGEGGGTRGLIIRAWRARLGGRDATSHLATYLTEARPQHFRTALELAPPPALSALKAGDFVEADLEWCMFPRRAEDYYGPDESFRAFLREGANTWKPVHREAAGHAVVAQLMRGTLESAWPIHLRVDSRQRASFTLSSGLGPVAVTFAGLRQPRGVMITHNGAPLATCERGDFWQAELDEITQRWNLTCLLPAGKSSGDFTLEPPDASAQPGGSK